jgi:hypothetical protein
MLMKPRPVPRSWAISRVKCILPMPGGPSSSMGVISSASRLSWHRASWRRSGVCRYSAIDQVA